MFMGIGLHLGGRYAAGGGAPPVIVGNSATVVSGGITWTLSAACDYGYDQIGRAFVVAVPGLTVLSRSPAATTIGADAVSGTMKNPQFSGAFGADNGWDQRISGYNAANNQSFPVSVAAGDILVGQIHGSTPAAPRDGYANAVNGYNPIYFVSTGWGANAIAPAPIGWSGRGTPQPYYVNCLSIAAGLSSRDITSIAKPALVDVLDAVQRNEIALAYTSAVSGVGYQEYTTQGAGLTSGVARNYGQNLAKWRGAAGLYLISNAMTTAEKAELLAWMISNGLAYDTRAGAASPIIENGGHYQFHFIDMALALYYTGRASKLADMITEVPGNVLGQPFKYTADQISQLSPHSSLTQAFVGRRRNITAVSGNVITLEWTRSGTTGDPAQVDLLGMELVRESDGASAVLTVASVSPDANTSSTYAVTIAAQPAIPFAISDVVYFRNLDPVLEGDADWRINDSDSTINPAYEASYRNLNFWTEELLTVSDLGIWHPSWDAFQEYTIRANRIQTPAITRDFPTHHDEVDGFAFAQEFWDAHAATIIQGAPIFFSRPGISGSAVVGETLTAVPASVSGTAPVTNTYQWQLAGVDIPGATGSTYTVVTGDIGSGISLRQTATNADGSASEVSIETAPVASAYAPVAVEFGAGEKAQITSGFTATGSKKLLFAFNFFRPSAWFAATTDIIRMTNVGSNRVAINGTTNGRMTFTCLTAGGTNVVAIATAATSTFAADTWYTVAFAVDSATSTFQWYMRPAGGSWTAVSFTGGAVTADAIIGDCNRFYFNESVANIYYADVWGSIAETLDLSVSGNRTKFEPLTDKGSSGTIPTGTQPPVFLSGAVGSWHTNKGTGGGLTLTGTLSTAPSAPT